MYTSAASAPSNAIYNTGTYNRGATPCALTVAGSQNGGGSIRVSDATNTALYVQPPSFQVLLDAGQAATLPFSEDFQRYQVYDVASGAAFQTATSPMEYETTARTLLPTVNRVLAYGADPGNGSELYSPAAAAWTRTGLPSTTRAFPGLITLFDGTALAAGGDGPGLTRSLATCEIFSPATNSWAPTGSMSYGRSWVCCSAFPQIT